MLIKKSKPLRSKDHRMFIKSMECTIINDEGLHCNGLPVDAHHLMKIGNRGIARKEDDNWIVPLCRTHHREVTDYGDEVNFWQEHGFLYKEILDMAIEYAMDSPCELVHATVQDMEQLALKII